MKQLMHIFAKDARRLWPEITVVLAVTALFAWIYPRTWAPETGFAVASTGTVVRGEGLQALAHLAAFLVPLSWWILILRLVQGENLVGDKQWWVTRPYEWPALLGAKVLFLAAFAGAPLVLAQWVLMARAGFAPLPFVPGQAYDLLLLAMVLGVPVMALASVTSSFARTAVTGFVLLVVLMAALLVQGWTKMGDFSVALPWHLEDWLAVATAAAVVFVYARRRVGLTRWLLAAVLVAGFGMTYLGYSATLIEARYPASGAGGLAVRLGADGGRLATANRAQNPGRKKFIDVSLPVTVTGLGPEDAANLDAAQVTVKTPDGKDWTSPWELENQDHLQADMADAAIVLGMPEALLERVKAEPVELDLRLAVTQLRAAWTAQAAMEGRDFALPGLGICAPVPDSRSMTPYPTGIKCRAPLRDPPLTFISVRWAEGGCAGGPAAAASGLAGGGWAGGVSGTPADLNLEAVWSSQVGLSNGFDQEKAGKRGENPQQYLCPGTPILVTRYALVRRMQTQMTVTNFHIPDWDVPGALEGGSTAVVTVP